MAESMLKRTRTEFPLVKEMLSKRKQAVKFRSVASRDIIS